MKLFAYLRVSTISQIEGGGLKIQEDSIRRYCEAQQHTILKVYCDKGVSGAKTRPQLERMLSHLNEVDGIIVYDLTRIGRSTLDLLEKIYNLDNQGKIFISVKEGMDISTKTGKLILTVLSGIADFERQTIIERMESGKEYAKEHGTKSGKPMHRPKIEIDWNTVDSWLEKGLSLGAISKIIGISRVTLYTRYKNEHKEHKKTTTSLL